jgi:eukaryotic-like serine/threonine-protein kinase
LIESTARFFFHTMIGTKVAHYEITTHIGSGGMGDVYQATDSKLGRSVAIKFLPEAFSHDTERVARFQREARILASLNHPNIAAIHGLEEIDSRYFLVMELVQGETLADRIKRGAIPIEEALPIAKQVAEALEEAHEKGIIHRDLKPANIKITPDGKVKVLDFGLAKAYETETSKPNLSQSPTISVAATNAGVILGTAAYMSPEQARGTAVDKRSDLWAFGVVLYEMFAGVQLFDGATVSDTLAQVLMKEPDWDALPAKTHGTIRRLLRRCLEKDRRRRLPDAGAARLEIEDAMATPSAEATTIPRGGSGRMAWIVAAAAILAAAGLAVPAFRYLREAPPPEMRVDITTPKTTDPISFALSPDGRKIVFAASGDAGASRLWLKPLDSVTAQPLVGTEGASYPFWSPDSASIGFFADLKLKRIDIVGGALQVLANANNPRGGSWNRDGTILFAATAVGPLLKLAATGGEPVAVTRRETGQTGHVFPQFLPDGRHFIYFVLGSQGQGVYAGSLDGGSSKRLANADTPAVVSPSGFLLFARQTALFAQVFDSERQELSGNPFPVAEQVAGFSATSGIVAYRSGAAGGPRQLMWLDRSGKSAGTIGAPDASLSEVELSPDGKRVALHRAVNGNIDIWLIDAVRGVPTRFTFDAAPDQRPVWSADGSRVAFDSIRKGVINLYWKLSSGAGADELLLETDQNKSANDWSFDGRFLLFRSTDPRTGIDLWVLPVFGDKKPFPFLKTSFDERNGQFSPDGKWIAYQSDESGRFEIYVQPFPVQGGKFQISTNGGAQVRWNKNGKEIFYVSLDSKMMAAPVKLSLDGQSLETGTPIVLFPVRIAGGPLQGSQKQQYAVSSDGQRFLVNLALDDDTTSPITMILNWRPEPGK